jgi:ADP-ribosyl-[dinitrogen reductase] hydrolase
MLFYTHWKHTEETYMQNHQNTSSALSRAEGCLLGQLSGDSLGGLVEFKTPQQIRTIYPDGVTELQDGGGTWDILAGQPTDDSELALMLARSLVAEGTYNREKVFDSYVFWLRSRPFDSGTATRNGLSGNPLPDTQANGALMRISPLGIFGTHYPAETVAAWAEHDAAMTHPHQVTRSASALFAMAIAHVIKTGCSAHDVYQYILTSAATRQDPNELQEVIRNAATNRPATYTHQQGWVLIAFQNALWQLLHAESFRAGVQDTVMQGGDTDTNAAICGALLGAVHGREAVPQTWVHAILNCRPSTTDPRAHRPRPEVFWPVDALDLAAQLVGHTPGL